MHQQPLILLVMKKLQMHGRWQIQWMTHQPLKKLIEALAMVHDAVVNQRMCSGRLHFWRKSDESERVAVDALIDMCDSLSPEATRLHANNL